MMGSGYFGSSSSSSLSPLAPPFTVDRSNHNKPALNSNAVSDFSDQASYAAVPFTSSLPYSQSTGGQDLFGESPTTTNDYGYVVPDPIVTSPTTHSHNWGGLSSNGSEKITNWSYFSAVNLSPKRVADSGVYNLSEAKPFQLPYASSVKIDDVPFVSFSEETDYTRILSGLEYNPNPNPNFKQEENIASSIAYNNCSNQGAYCTETLSKSKDDHHPSMLSYADIIRRANDNVKSDSTSFFSNNQGLDSNKFPKEFPVFSEAHPSLIQSPEDLLWNSQKLTPSYGKTYHHMFEDCMLKSKKSSPVVIKAPSPTVSSFSPSPKSSEIGNAAAGALKLSDVVVGSSHISLKEKEDLQLPQLTFQMGTTDAASSSKKDTKLSSASDQLNFEFKSRPSFLQVPDINIPDAANLLDHHNSAEDSPCWKGAPFLPFGSPQTQPATKKLQKDLLLRAEGLKEHDYRVLDHVTRNLDACMSRQVQSSISQEVINGQDARCQKMKSDVFGKNLQEHNASLRDLDPPKGDNMVQAIKKVLDENLEREVELSSETTLLYKNLWLEAEAELCCMSYRARFERLKREIQKETPHKLPETRGNITETLRSCNGSTSPKADNCKVSNAQHIHDVVNVHGQQNLVKEDGKVTGSGVTVQHQLCKDDDDDELNILKHRGELNATDLIEGACGESHIQDQAVGSGSDWEHILKDEFS